LGFNAIDFAVLDFKPTDNSYRAGSSLLTHFRYFDFGEHSTNFLQVKAWKKSDELPDLVIMGGHDVRFASKKIFPYKFLLRHYPIRSQSQGEKKVFAERKARWNAPERQIGWHTQYDSIDRGSSFLKNRKGLIFFDNGFYSNYLLERLTGIGIQFNDKQENRFKSDSLQIKELNTKELQIKELNDNLEKLIKQLANRTGQIAILKLELSALNNKFVFLSNQYELQKQNADLLKRMISENGGVIAQLNGLLAEKENQVDHLRSEAFIKDNEIVSYALSKSWRITRPLRKLVKKLKGKRNA